MGLRSDGVEERPQEGQMKSLEDSQPRALGRAGSTGRLERLLSGSSGKQTRSDKSVKRVGSTGSLLCRSGSVLKSEPQPNKPKLPKTDIGNKERYIWVFTTASLPWFTGTAVNPLLRAAHLQRGRAPGRVTLVVPWLDKDDQVKVYGDKIGFEAKEEQEGYVRKWLRESAGMPEESEILGILFYQGGYHESFGSIFPLGDLTSLVPNERADVCVLEEPEHLNWFRAEGEAWRDKFNYVVGIIHTNYIHYAAQTTAGGMKREGVRFVSTWMVRAYCHRILKLSDTLQTFAPTKELVVNVHGVREEFLHTGDELAKCVPTRSGFSKGAYFIGKSLWGKGLDLLLPLLRVKPSQKHKLEVNFSVDIFGSGPDREAIEAKANKYKLQIVFHDGIDHVQLKEYSTLVNPSTSEVLCTIVAEALAMGKFAVIAKHPSNEFFYQFPNCMPFETQAEFIACVDYTLHHSPLPLTHELRHILSWPAATDRFTQAASKPIILSDAAQKWENGVDSFLAVTYGHLTKGKKGDYMRMALGGGPAARQHKHTRKSRGGEGEGGEDSQESSGSSGDDEEGEGRRGKGGDGNDRRSAQPLLLKPFADLYRMVREQWKNKLGGWQFPQVERTRSELVVVSGPPFEGGAFDIDLLYAYPVS